MLGRRASGESFAKGRIEQSSQIWRGGKLCHRECLRISPKNQSSAWGINNASVLGTLVALPKEEGAPLLDRVILKLRAMLSEQPWGITIRGGTLLVRYLGQSVEACRQGFGQARRLLAESAVFNGSTMACEPRVWKT